MYMLLYRQYDCCYWNVYHVYTFVIDCILLVDALLSFQEISRLIFSYYYYPNFNALLVARLSLPQIYWNNLPNLCIA